MAANIEVQQPTPFDLVGEEIRVAGLGVGFEATLEGRVRDHAGAEIGRWTFMTPSGISIDQFQTTHTLGAVPSTPSGFVEVFELSAADGSEVNKVVVPVVFGTNLVPGYLGYQHRTVEPGDTLSSLANAAYGDPSLWPAIFEANRLQIADPDLISVGQVLRIPIA